MPQAHEMGML